MTYLLKGGLVATWTSDNQPLTLLADVLVEDATIVRVDKQIDVGPNVQVVDCTGKWIIPGMVDTHRYERVTST